MDNLVVAEKEPVLALTPYQTPEEARRELQRLQSYVKVYLLENVDYGKQPGTDKDTLFKSGAEKLADLYRLRPEYEISEQVNNWDTDPFLFDYTFKCTIYRADGSIAAVGYGNCNSWESKYRWRDQKRCCPDCSASALGKSKEEYGGGYYCSAKLGGCGASWKQFKTDRKGNITGPGSESDLATIKDIEAQVVGKMPNPDIASQKNTVIKMAKKRALVDATICATRSSGLFTQDVGDPESDETSSKNPTAQQWKDLYKEGMSYGASVADMRAFCKDLQNKGKALKEIFVECAKHFIGDEPKEEAIDFDSLDILDVQFREAMEDPNA